MVRFCVLTVIIAAAVSSHAQTIPNPSCQVTAVPPVIRSEGITERLGSWMQSSDRITFEVLETFAKGPMVINHRIDTFASKTRPLTWEGVGVFFIKDGKIQEWSDYTIKVTRPGQ